MCLKNYFNAWYKLYHVTNKGYHLRDDCVCNPLYLLCTNWTNRIYVYISILIMRIFGTLQYLSLHQCNKCHHTVRHRYSFFPVFVFCRFLMLRIYPLYRKLFACCDWLILSDFLLGGNLSTTPGFLVLQIIRIILSIN